MNAPAGLASDRSIGPDGQVFAGGKTGSRQHRQTEKYDQGSFHEDTGPAWH